MVHKAITGLSIWNGGTCLILSSAISHAGWVEPTQKMRRLLHCITCSESYTFIHFSRPCLLQPGTKVVGFLASAPAPHFGVDHTVLPCLTSCHETSCPEWRQTCMLGLLVQFWFVVFCDLASTRQASRSDDRGLPVVHSNNCSLYTLYAKSCLTGYVDIPA